MVLLIILIKNKKNILIVCFVCFGLTTFQKWVGIPTINTLVGTKPKQQFLIEIVKPIIKLCVK
jgi:hypothetical protein